MTEIYHYAENGIYIGSGIADKCQITGVDLIPAYATIIEPPTVDLPDLAIWTGETWGVFKPILEPETTISELRETMVLTKSDAKLRLLERGLYTQINNAILAMDDCIIKVKWIDADSFRRTDADLVAYLHSLGMTDEQIDDLFTSPNKL